MRQDNEKNLSRRQFLRDTGLLVGGAALSSMAFLDACHTNALTSSTTLPNISIAPTGSDVIYSPDTLRGNRIPPGQHEITNWPVLQADDVPTIIPDTWNFAISGLVESELKLNYADFFGLPRVRVVSDIHCVTRWTRLNNLWEGCSSTTIANLVRLKPEAKYVIVQATNGFTANLTLADFIQEDVLFAFKHDDEALSAEHGAPVRLIVPRLYFWKSAKWVTGIRFTSQDQPGFWERQGYNNHGDPWKEERMMQIPLAT
jgi:DMSO/TMAO reductase YedYZ molybdopterin-dependent catalytic subunit